MIKARTLLWVVTIGVIFDLAVSAIVVAVAFRANSAASSAHIARVAIYESCLAANSSRADSEALWLSVIALIPPTTERARQFDTQLRSLTLKAFAQRQCVSP